MYIGASACKASGFEIIELYSVCAAGQCEVRNR